MPEILCADYSHAYGPAAISLLREALRMATDRWDLPEPCAEPRRAELATIIMHSAHMGFAQPHVLAKMALDQLKIAAAARAYGGTAWSGRVEAEPLSNLLVL
jgi:hypothetical protein